jgi:uncharacterized membrane protein
VNILLLNDNPVVTKLVTLSAQKTSDELEIVDSVEDIQNDSYDLFVLDDTLYSEDIMSELKGKVTFTKSLYICSRSAEEIPEFTTTLRKPFLPTDLVELFANISKDVSVADEDTSSEVEEEDELEDIINDGALLELDADDVDELDDLDENDLDLESELGELDDLSLDELDDDEDLDLELDEVNTEEVVEASTVDEVDELEEFDSEELELEDDDIFGESILDKDELQEVQELLEESEEDLEVNTEELNEAEESDEVESLEETNLEEELSLDEEELEIEEELSLDEEELETEEELSIDDELNEEDIETQIESAVSELSDEELESELDADTLLDIAVNDFDGLDALNTRDIKMAIGEEVSEEVEAKELVVDSEILGDSDAISSVEEEIENKEITSGTDGVEALKKLLKALSNEDVAASLKGMKININITLGDN